VAGFCEYGNEPFHKMLRISSVSEQLLASQEDSGLWNQLVADIVSFERKDR
jgi:hypothetical protein